VSRSILVCFAVKEEAAPFLRQLPVGVETLVTGMGAAAAERATLPRLAARKWDFVFTCGFAGGLNPALQPETVVFDADEDFPLVQALRNAGAAPARFHCADRVAVTPAEKSALRARTGADAVEMESGVIRRLCSEHGVPSATVRVVSDTADEALPLDFNALMKPDGTLHFGKLLGAVLRQPQKIPALMALGQRSKSAAQRLATVLHATLGAAGR
jgi:nucleoside phosphorylase